MAHSSIVREVPLLEALAPS